MNKEEDRKNLKDLYFEFKQMKLSHHFVKNTDLADWIDDIMVLDAYYAGLALTVAEGGKIALSDLYNIEAYENSLNSIQVNDEEVVKILKYCNLYLNKLNQIDKLLRKN